MAAVLLSGKSTDQTIICKKKTVQKDNCCFLSGDQSGHSVLLQVLQFCNRHHLKDILQNEYQVKYTDA